jgi:hypothetical protein
MYCWRKYNRCFVYESITKPWRCSLGRMVKVVVAYRYHCDLNGQYKPWYLTFYMRRLNQECEVALLFCIWVSFCSHTSCFWLKVIHGGWSWTRSRAISRVSWLKMTDVSRSSHSVVRNWVTSSWVKKKVKISLLQAVEVPRVARGRGSHIT